MDASVIPLAGSPPVCDFGDALTWPIGDLDLSRSLPDGSPVACHDLQRTLMATEGERPPLVRYFLMGPSNAATPPTRIHFEIRPAEALRILFQAGWSDRLPTDLLELLSEGLLGEEIPDPVHRDLRLFVKLTADLRAMLFRRLDMRAASLNALAVGNDPERSEWEALERETLQGLQIAYREARKLRLETDPAPLLSALFPVDDQGDLPSIERCLDALLALTLDAQARLPGHTLGGGLAKPIAEADTTADEPAPPQDLVTLDQAAAMVHKSKRTLERAKTGGSLPPPAVEGGGGRADYYEWSVLRPWLTREYGIRLPEKFPRKRGS